MQPLGGRRLWFVGIGGAGLSSYAFLARAWGAEVGGWDRVETPYLSALEGVELVLAPEPVVPDGWEAIVSSAYPSVAGTPRADFLAELVSLRRSIVVAGAHGKTTTTGMIAFVLAELGLDPAWLVGGEIAQLGGNAGAGEGWLVAEGDESDRTVERLRPQIAVVTNVELDHHSTFASAAEVEELFDRWLAEVPHVVRGWELEPVSFELLVARRAQPQERCRRACGARACRSRPRRRRARTRPLPRRDPAFRARRRAPGRHGRRRLRAPSLGDRSDRRGGAGANGRPRARSLPAASVLADAPPGARARRRALDRRRRLRHGDLPREGGADRRRRTGSSSSTRCGRASARAGRRASRTACGSWPRGRVRATSC